MQTKKLNGQNRMGQMFAPFAFIYPKAYNSDWIVDQSDDGNPRITAKKLPIVIHQDALPHTHTHTDTEKICCRNFLRNTGVIR